MLWLQWPSAVAALPLPAELVNAMAAVAIRRGDTKFGIALFLGWLLWKLKNSEFVSQSCSANA